MKPLATYLLASLLAVGCSYRKLGDAKGDGGDAAVGADAVGGADRSSVAETSPDTPADVVASDRSGDAPEAGSSPDAADAEQVLTDADQDRGTLDMDGGSGEVRPAVLAVVPMAKDYNVVVTGANADADFEVSNTGGQATGVPSAMLTGGDAAQFAIMGNTCTTTLASSDRCTITVRFTPTSTDSKSTTLRVAATPGGAVMVTLMGAGVTQGALKITPANGDFDPLLPGATSPPISFTVRNTGGSATGPLSSAISSSEFHIASDTCTGTTLAGSATCTITVTLLPTAAGPESGTLTVMATPGGTAAAALTGTALHPAVLSIVPTSFSFPDTEVNTASATRTFTVTNSGDVPAGATTALATTLSGTNPGDFEIVSSTCTGTLEGGGQCQVVAGFAPTAPGGRSANLVVSGTPGGAATSMLSSSGLRPPAISAMPLSLDFGKVEIGVQTSTRTWTITNNGDVPTGTLTFTNSNPSEVVVTNGCTAPLTGGAQCAVTVSVKASANGPRSGALTVVAARGGSVSLSVTASAGYRLTVVPGGIGSGTVTSVPAGVSCGATCSAILDAGTAVTLQARTTNGSQSFFSGWSGGGCSGPMRDCALTLSSSITVNATFSPMTNNLIFVSSGSYPTNRGSAAAYDNDCNIAATAAGINDAAGGSYVAFTSDSASLVTTRLGSARGWVRMDGKPFSDSGLFSSNQVFNSIRFTELGQIAGPSPMLVTGASPSGAANNNCMNFTVLTGDSILCGLAEGGPGRFTDVGATCHTPCGGPYRIICMGKSKTTALTLTPATGRLVWLDSTVYSVPNQSAITPPDQVCQAERPAGVTTAAALLAYSNKGTSAVLSAAVNYVRPDGTLVGTGAQIAAAGPIESGIWQSNNGTYRVGGGQAGMAFTGGPGGTVANTCSDWTTSAGTGVLADYGRTDGNSWWTVGTNNCSAVPVWFYCVQTAP